MNDRNPESLCTDIEDDCVSSIVVEELAQAISRRGLVTPMLCLLEMHRPLGSLLHFAVSLSQPLVALVCGAEKAGKCEQLLRSPTAIEDLIRRLEETSSEI